MKGIVVWMEVGGGLDFEGVVCSGVLRKGKRGSFKENKLKNRKRERKVEVYYRVNSSMCIQNILMSDDVFTKRRYKIKTLVAV